MVPRPPGTASHFGDRKSTQDLRGASELPSDARAHRPISRLRFGAPGKEHALACECPQQHQPSRNERVSRMGTVGRTNAACARENSNCPQVIQRALPRAGLTVHRQCGSVVWIVQRCSVGSARAVAAEVRAERPQTLGIDDQANRRPGRRRGIEVALDRVNRPPAKAGGFADASEGARSTARADGCSDLRLAPPGGLSSGSVLSLARKKPLWRAAGLGRVLAPIDGPSSA